MRYEYKISICMMVKDEEKNLTRCLEKIKPLTEAGIAELIIIDTGSKDNTVKIAESYTNKIYFHNWNNNFSEMRNKSISYTNGEWIFIIDADERLDDTNELINLLKSYELDKFNTVQINVKNLHDSSDENKYNLNTSPRLFKNDGSFKYVGAVHNQPIFKEPILSSDISLTHFGYISNDKNLMENKFNRTTELLKKELEKDSNNLYYIYQLGVSYDMHGDYECALNEFRKAYSLLSSKSTKEKKLYIYVLAAYANSAFINLKFDKAINAAKETISLNSEFVDMYYIAGFCEKHTGNIEKSFNYLCKYIDLVNRYNTLQISKNNSIAMYYINSNAVSKAYFEICKYYLSKEKYMDAYDIYNNITRTSEKIYTSINILVPLEKYSDLRKVYDSLISTKDRNSFLCTLEERIKKLEDSKKFNLYKEFSLNEDLYGSFIKLRISSNANNKINLAELLIKEIDFDNEPVFYSEIFENVKENIRFIIDIFKKIEVLNLKNIVKYLIEEKGFKETFENYILDNIEAIKDIEESRVFIGIANMLLLLYIKDNNKVSEKYLKIFKAYINVGISITEELYRVDTAEGIYKNISDHEERFFMIMFIINKLLKENNKKSAVKYMIEAVNTYEAYAKYINIYKDELFNLEENNEFKDYKLKVKENINNLVNSGLLEEAKGLIGEYENIVKDDVEIYSIKAVIAIMENKFEEAELILKKGLTIDENNFDLFYNLGYLYSIQNRKIEALSAYTISKLVGNDDDYKKLAEENILRLSSEKTNTENVIFCGNTEQCISFENSFKEWNVIGYVINEKDNGKNKKALQIDKIKNYSYDFILILDEVNENKILEELIKYGVKKNIYLYSNFKTSVIEGFNYRIRELLYRNNIEIITTGLSYAEVGINVEQLNKSAINFAFSSQDLFYDYHIANYLLNYGNVKNSIKYMILGLSYYCFDYDMSKSVAKYRIHRYINSIQNLHNNKDKIGTNITKVFYEKRIGMQEYYDMNKRKESTMIRYDDKEQEYIAKKNSTMNYNLTRNENIDILYKYLSLLKVNNIKPIIVICPTSKYYYKHFNDCYQKNKFYKILDSFKKDFDFQVIDYFNSNLFVDEDFWDYGHLNGIGAKKFTQILNEEIIW